MDQMEESLAVTTTANQSAKARVYSEEEWEAQKSSFEKLYKNNSLPRVMIAMQCDHGFTATKRQYKRRIQKWGLDKNVKGNEMMAIAVQQVKRKFETGKDSSFYLRDRKVTDDKIKRYIKRQKIHESDLLSGVIPVANSTTAVTCNTPPHDSSDCSQFVSTQATILGSDFPETYDLIYPWSSNTFHDPQIQRNSLEVNKDKKFFNISPSPPQSKAYFSTALLSLRDQQGSSTSPLPSNGQSTNRGIVRCPSPSFSDTATEILEPFSPRLTPGILSPSLPSCKLPGFEQDIYFFENLESSESTPRFGEANIPRPKRRELLKTTSSLLETAHVLFDVDEKNDAQNLIIIILDHLQRTNSMLLVNSTFERSSIGKIINEWSSWDVLEQAFERCIMTFEVQHSQFHREVVKLVIQCVAKSLNESRFTEIAPTTLLTT